MHNSTKQIPDAAPRRPHKARGVLLAVLMILVLIAAAVLIFPHVMNPDRAVRFFRYMGLRDKEGYGRISFEGGAGNVYAGFDDGLLVGTESSLSLYSLDGEQKALVQGALPAPVLRTGGEVSFLFSPGSSYAVALGSGGRTLLDGALDGAVLDASVSTDGFTARLTAQSGYKAVATVLNPNQDAVYRFSSRTRYLNACAVSEKGAYLAVASLEEQDSIYRSGITILRTDQPLTDLEEDDAAVRVELGNQLIYELRFLDREHLLAVAQDELIFLDTAGQLLASLPLAGDRLIDYDISEEGWLILALEVSGGDCKVLTFDAEGSQISELELPERVRSVSSAGRYAAVLTEMYLQTYDRHLVPYDRTWDVPGAVRVVARPDGTALLIASSGTKLFIP